MPGHRFSSWLRPLLTLVGLAGVLSLAACGGGNGSPATIGGGISPLTRASFTTGNEAAGASGNHALGSESCGTATRRLASG